MDSYPANGNVVVRERYGGSTATLRFVGGKGQNAGCNKLTTIHQVDCPPSSLLDNLKIFLQQIFLPQGYPDSVSKDYVPYQIWDTAQAFCSTITGTLATHAVMKGVGVGDTEATPLAATITWVLKDGTGHVGRIAFAWWKGSSLDADSKMWRLVADVLNDAALCLEVALPLFHGYTTPILCLSTAIKAIVGVAGGATRAALTQHQAVRGNLADVAAKDGSQETAVNLVASFVAVFILSVIGNNVWPVFFIFTWLHVLSNYYAVSSVCLNTFNSTRLLCCVLGHTATGALGTPAKVNRMEARTFFTSNINDKSICGFRIKMGTSISSFMKSHPKSSECILQSIHSHGSDKYLLLPAVGDGEGVIHVVLSAMATPPDILLSYYHAVCLGIIITTRRGGTLDLLDKLIVQEDSMYVELQSISKKSTTDDVSNSLGTADNFIRDSFDKFRTKAEQLGWTFERHLLICDEWRANWAMKNE